MLRTELNSNSPEFREKLELLADRLYELIPVGVGASFSDELRGIRTRESVEAVLTQGMNFAVERGLAWPEDLEVTEHGGCISPAEHRSFGLRALALGMNQLGTLGSGNHYVEVQAIEEIYDAEGARAMGLHSIGQVCVMIHCGSRGLGHQTATDFITALTTTTTSTGAKGVKKKKGKNERDGCALAQVDSLAEQLGNDLSLSGGGIKSWKPSALMSSEPELTSKCIHARDHTLNDPSLAYFYASSGVGREYLAAMNAAANFAYVNRSVIGMAVRRAFAEVFGVCDARDPSLAMHLVYDVSHNMAKVEEHLIPSSCGSGKVTRKQVLVHRKGSTRALPPGHPDLPSKYQDVGQPVLVGGSMGTARYLSHFAFRNVVAMC